MRKILMVLLATLLLTAIGSLPSFSEVEITEEMMEEATPADEATIKIEIAKEQEETRPWEKYLYLDVDHNFNEDSQTLWTRVGTRKGSFDFSVGWTQKFNQLGTELTDKGMVSMSVSYWW